MLPSFIATSGTERVWMILARVGSRSVLTGYWYPEDGHLEEVVVNVFGDDPSKILARFPVAA